MENKELRVLYKEVNKDAREIIIKDDLEVLHKLVGGYIEVCSLTDDIDIICNEEGKLIGLQPNINLDYDIIVGNIIFVSHKDAEFESLTDEQIKYILRELRFRDIIYM